MPIERAKVHFRRTLPLDGGRLHFAAHSHHPWPDVSFDAHARAWEDAAHMLDAKWDYIFAAVWPAAQRAVASVLSLPDPATIAFGPNTHGFLLRILSCIARSPIRILTTDAEFMSFTRQIARLEEEGLVAVTRVPAEPFATFDARFASAARGGGHDLVWLSHVFYSSGFVADLETAVEAVRDHDTVIVIDGYHGFMAVETDLQAFAGRIFYVSGGYKYAMTGEGACFLHCPPGYGLRPLDTGWYAGFGALTAGSSSVAYAEDGGRFLGATFDPSGLYRLGAVLEWCAAEGYTVTAQRRHAADLAEKLGAHLRPGLLLDRSMLMLRPGDLRRGRFLTFRTDEAARIGETLRGRGVICDWRGDRLRLGFGIYQDEDDVMALAGRLSA